jgi:GH15 family glucan-1,4-alpha-glucosidase
MDGSIDWWCFPHFDAPSVFAAILDDKRGGTFRIAPADGVVTRRQFYWPDTNVLITRFLSPDGIAEIVDFMPMGAPPDGHGYHRLVRCVRMVHGCMKFRLTCRPAFNYARDEHQTTINDRGAVFRHAGLGLRLDAPVPVRVTGDGVTAEFTLKEDDRVSFSLCEVLPGEGGPGLSDDEAEALLKATVGYWQRWVSHCTYRGRWREMVTRSALVLKLLTYEPSGAIVAAATCSLPEHVGGERNWDYRYTWIRDAAFTIYGLMRIGFTHEAGQFMRWLETRCCELAPDEMLQTVYTIDGRRTLNEEVLRHLEGYRGSRPVRIGNEAYRQFQLDIYGELLDSVYLYNKYGTPISYELWTHLRRLANWVCENWHRPDEGIWEVRSARQHFVYSKLMCWVALDRAVRLADKRSFPADRARWQGCRDQIYEDIMEKGWSRERRAFVQHYGSEHLDAANLIMPLVFFLAPTDPRMLQTLDATHRSPKAGGLVLNSLVYRYDVTKTEDGIMGDEGTFTMCSFWLVEALTRAGRVHPARLEQARIIFEQMLGYANHLGLYAEQIGPGGEALGNFPQALTHLALISSAVNLDRALGKEG